MRRLAILILTACSSGTEAPPKPEPKPEPKPQKPAEPITGSHGGIINAIAVTADAAVTGDTTGGMRLWPTLDGTREPIAIKAPVADALAIVKDGSGFAIAVTDAAHQVEVVRVDGRGNVRSRRKLGEAAQVEAYGDALLVFRVDQVIEHVAIDGTLLGKLAAEPGTQIQSLVVRDKIALAIVSGEKTTHAQKLVIGDSLAWGDKSAALPIAKSTVVAAPDGKSIVALAAKNRRITQYDLATGKGKPVCPESSQAAFRSSRHFNRFGGLEQVTDAPIAVFDGKIACFVDNTFSWWNVEDGATTTSVPSHEIQVFTASGNRVISSRGQQLVIQTPQRTDYLGYGFRDLTHVRSVPTGLMIGKGDKEPVLLDDKFRERARYVLPKLPVDWSDLVPVDDRFLLTSSIRSGGADLWGNAFQISIYDTVKQVMHQVLPQQARNPELVYEASTQLLVTSDGNKSVLVKLDLATHTLGNDVELDLPAVPKRIALLDPALSGGLIALAIRDHDGGLDIAEFHGADVPPAQELDGKYVSRSMKPRKTYRIEGGELRAVDRAGKVYADDMVDVEDVDIYASGRQVGTLVKADASVLRPSPDGKHVLAIEGSKLTLFTADGTMRWQIAAWGSSDVDWTPAGVLYGRFPGAIARIDEATGVLAERQCGWSFGISSSPRDGTTNAPSVCDVAP